MCVCVYMRRVKIISTVVVALSTKLDTCNKKNKKIEKILGLLVDPRALRREHHLDAAAGAVEMGTVGRGATDAR